MTELERQPEWVVGRDEHGWIEIDYPGETAAVRAHIEDRRLRVLETTADLPLRGRVPVRWTWRWPGDGDSEPDVELRVDGALMFRADAERRTLSAEEAAALADRSAASEEREVPPDNWPARIDMQREALADGVWVVQGVRTGFHHLVVETSTGLIVADAPAGWVEMHQIPPADLVPGLGVSGLSERFVDFLREHWPEQPIRAVALTHLHDDHAGGARAFGDGLLDLFDLSPQFFDEGSHEGEVQLFLCIEVLVDSRLGDLSLEGDVIHGCLGIAPCEEDLGGRVENALRPLLLLALFPAFYGVFVPGFSCCHDPVPRVLWCVRGPVNWWVNEPTKS
jgi:hypothetical protein